MTPPDAYAMLQEQLRAAPPLSVRDLDPAELADLADAVERARHRQAAELAAAGDAAFNHIPRLLRGPIRKILR